MILINKALKVAFASPGPEVWIGRSPDCSLQLNFPTISKMHVRLLLEGNSWILEDQGSVNLTYLNGENITGRHPIHPGDYLRLDVYTLVFFDQEPPQLPEISVQDPSSVIRHRLPLSLPEIRIGRKLINNHIAVDDGRVSGQHMTLARQDRRWVASSSKKEAVVKINQIRIDEPSLVNPGDKIQIGSTILEVSAPVVKEFSAVSQTHTRLGDLYRTVRMQARTIEDAIHENFPAARGENDWIKQVLDVLALIDDRLRHLKETSEALRALVPSMETEESDNALLTQAIRDSRRCTNLANYLDLVLRNNQLTHIQNADLSRQRDLIARLHKDVLGCLDTDDPTILMK